MDGNNGLENLIPLFVMGLILLPFALKISVRIGKSKVIYGVLMLIPIVNALAFYYLVFDALAYVIDRVNAIEEKVSRT
jgi:hypothetical protein